MDEAMGPDGDVHAWERFALWDWLFVGTLAAPTVIAIARPDVPFAERLGTVALAAVLAAAYGLVWARRDRLAEGSWPYLLYYLAALALASVLIERDDLFFLVFFGLYPQAFLYLGRWWPVGVLIAAVVPTARTAQAVAAALYFPMIFLSGAVIPRFALPDFAQRIGDVLPLTYVVRAVQEPWIGNGWDPLALAVLAGITAVASFVAARTFRWE